MTTGIPPSIILYPDASSIHGSSPASVLSSSLLHVLQLFTTQHNFASTLHLYSAMLGFVGLAYAVILSIFRLLFFECDSISDCLLQMSFCVLLILAQSCSGNLSESVQLIANMIIAVAASAFIWWLHKHYVSGRKYKSSNIDGRVYIITGSNAGLGFETAKHIVAMGGTVILACRSIEKAQVARDLIIEQTKCQKGKIIVMQLDLSVTSSVRQFAVDFQALNLPLHALINNAGVMMSQRHLTEEGFERVFVVNYLGHFLLTNLLLPELEKSNGRVVNVASTMHKLLTHYDFDNIMSDKSFSLFGTYAQSKLAMMLFTTELQRRMKAKGSKVTCNSLHPGCVFTDITRDLHVIVRVANAICCPTVVPLRKSAVEGAYTSIHLATSPDLDESGGKYYFHCQSIPMGKCALDLSAAEKLWKISEKLVGLVPSNQL